MKKIFTIAIMATVLGFTACSNDKKAEENIDSLNKAAADSLLNSALADTTAVDSIAKDSLAVDTLKK